MLCGPNWVHVPLRREEYFHLFDGGFGVFNAGKTQKLINVENCVAFYGFFWTFCGYNIGLYFGRNLFVGFCFR